MVFEYSQSEPTEIDTSPDRHDNYGDRDWVIKYIFNKANLIFVNFKKKITVSR